MNNISIRQQEFDQEVRALLDNKLTRRFMMRLVVEACHTFSSGFDYNARAYGILAKREVGLWLLNICREVDLEKTQLAEKEYFEMLKQQRKEIQYGE